MNKSPSNQSNNLNGSSGMHASRRRFQLPFTGEKYEGLGIDAPTPPGSTSGAKDRKLAADRKLMEAWNAEAYALDQTATPLADALADYRRARVVSFDVPGHKQGRGNRELTDYLGQQCLSVDVNSMKPLDNLINPVSIIKEAQELAADAFGASEAAFMVNGTSGAVQAMIMSQVGRGEKIIMPRNVHRSAINALILSGAVPIYVDPDTNDELGIPLAMKLDAVREAMDAHPDAKALLVNNPTYYGVCSKLLELTELAHERNMKVLVDEAHGTHFYFGKDLPINAMAAGADMAAVSLHKTGGSLTQSSLLLMGPNINANYVRQVINLTQTTSSSYLLMVSLDITRRSLALRGETTYGNVVQYADYAREEINKLHDYLAIDETYANGDSFYAFDKTKLSIHTRQVGLSGLEVYDLLRDDYNIQIEFGDLSNVLAILSVGDRAAAIERLIAALRDIRRLHKGSARGMLSSEYITPHVQMTPQEAFYSEKIQVPLDESLGAISTEFVMCYPPGIPILAPGELVTREALDYIHYAKDRGASMSGPEDPTLQTLGVIPESLE